MAMQTMFPYIDILRYGGTIPPGRGYEGIRVCCPDPDVINVFCVRILEE